MAALKPLKTLNPKSPDAKYTGDEPEWNTQPDLDNRVSRLGRAFSWYNYHYGKKDAKELIIDWLARTDRSREAKDFARVSENDIVPTHGWLARMSLRGLTLNEHESSTLNGAVNNLIAQVKVSKVAKAESSDAPKGLTIQDRLREKMQEAAGEIEGMFDEMISNGVKMSADYKPITVLRGMNVAPQLIGEISKNWQARLSEFEEAAKGKDEQLTEGYAHFGKAQIKSLIKFAEQVVADCGSYVQLKKVERKPRAKKAVSPEKLCLRFKYQKECADPKLTSEPVTKLVGGQEAWLYDTKKRKLIYVVADAHVGTFTVKGSSLIGFDAANSVQKTLRKPAEQIKALLTGGVANHRKYFKDIKTTEVKWNGRSNENLVLLKVR